MAAKKRGIPKKKAVSRKQTNQRKSQKPVIFNELKKILVGIAILVSVCLTVAMIADIFFQPGRIEKKEAIPQKADKPKIKPIQEGISQAKPKKPVTGLKGKPEETIKYEVFEDIDQTIIVKPMPPEKDHIPKIAIIIDDIGYDKKTALALCDLNPDITFSVLPFSPFGKYISEKLHKKGSQLMLHLPMEPVEYPSVNPGPGAILSSMSPDILLDQLRKNIQDVPHIVGVNNHMGSKLTTQSDQMNQIFTILKMDNLFFIDSRTAPKSQGQASARLLKIKFAHRDVFLDNIQDTVYITGQFKELLDLAKRHGSAIGIGHPYKATLETLLKELPKLKNKVEIVRASSLTAIPD
ncbi:MAG: divergent polysaccharide deacetylase family protein [Proteobacteria bacterium]|nr:divergent polysaccharide deacetylase family protein [Pseudomonadota bacterium]MBU1585695.1 divergent polysaccharide deacetylase family protein [Pseudomonadota bacterium]MBU2452138.1 divergent polysaccharide deacetylase family protein [Pseudomonadota bacterium]MBU2629212.1 divergent polysaccharide deacetylase family protein [Pseudomonadota bacterium]